MTWFDVKYAEMVRKERRRNVRAIGRTSTTIYFAVKKCLEVPRSDMIYFVSNAHMARLVGDQIWELATDERLFPNARVLRDYDNKWQLRNWPVKHDDHSVLRVVTAANPGEVEQEWTAAGHPEIVDDLGEWSDMFYGRLHKQVQTFIAGDPR